MKTIYLDFETIGTDDPAVIAEIADSIKPPGQYKKADSIAKWIEEEKPAVVSEAVAKTSFDGAVGRIVCAGMAVDDQPVRTFIGDEKDIINSLFYAIKVLEESCFVGHNIIGFDLKFLWKRSIVLGIRPPSAIPFQAKPWDNNVFDTMTRWDADTSKRISQDRLCRALGIPPSKDEMDGSMVWDKWREGKIDEIARYCEKDVEAVRQIHKRMTFQ